MTYEEMAIKLECPKQRIGRMMKSAREFGNMSFADATHLALSRLPTFPDIFSLGVILIVIAAFIWRTGRNEPLPDMCGQEPRRNSEQNARLHATLTEIARQVEWCGRNCPSKFWKRLCTAAWLRECGQSPTMIPGAGWQWLRCDFRAHIARLTVRQCADLTTWLRSIWRGTWRPVCRDAIRGGGYERSRPTTKMAAAQRSRLSDGLAAVLPAPTFAEMNMAATRQGC